ncbi:MAG: hypothetical protein LBS03_02345 [Bacteroidales bacterium]|jgi:hypothetical protein|nr:hypothetical protein [Bacteroidales bacterium]
MLIENTAIVKGDLSKYAKDFSISYGFHPPEWSLMPSPARLKLAFLKVFKAFILSRHEDVLPEGERVVHYLK